MKRLMQFTAAVAIAAAVSACDTTPDPNTTTGTGGTVGTTGSMEADRAFLEEQLAMGQAEIELGQLAQERGMHADVKEFGAMMVRDHQAASEELKPIAAKVNTTTAQAPARNDKNDHQEQLEELSKLSGRDFDRKYIAEMIDDHQDGIEDLEGKAEKAASPDVKAWATKTLPKMREHLERAKAIKETLDRANNY